MSGVAGKPTTTAAICGVGSARGEGGRTNEAGSGEIVRGESAFKAGRWSAAPEFRNPDTPARHYYYHCHSPLA